MDFKERLSRLKMSALDLARYINREENRVGYSAITRCIHHPTIGSKKTLDIIRNALDELEGMHDGR